MTNAPIIPAPKTPPKRERTPIIGILSLIFGAIAFIPFMGIFSILGFFFGILALLFKQVVTGILGTTLSLFGMIASPTVWVLVACLVAGGKDACVPGKIFLNLYDTLEEGAAALEQELEQMPMDETEEGEDLPSQDL